MHKLITVSRTDKLKNQIEPVDMQRYLMIRQKYNKAILYG